MFGAATVAICSTYVLGVTGNARLILYPITQSLRPSIYVRTSEGRHDRRPRSCQVQ